jgi:hypothetical protein
MQSGSATEVPVLDPAFLRGYDPGQFLTATSGMLADSSWLIWVGLGAVLFIGILIGTAVQRHLDRAGNDRNKAKWPRDWPLYREIFTKDQSPTVPGYVALSPPKAMGSGAMPLGRTYPRFNPVPDIYPLRELRRRVEFMLTKPVWVPYLKRFQHFSVLGATGKGKSTSYAIPILTYGALERRPTGAVDTSYFAIDVKSPQFARMFSQLYKDAGKEVLFIDPWSPDETLAFEPLWRASTQDLDIIAEVIATYSVEAGQSSSSDNSEFFKVAAIRLLRGVLELAQYFPRRHCSLPAVQQLIAAGGNALKEAFQNAASLLPPEKESTAAATVIARASNGGLQATPRSAELEDALRVLERCGYRAAFLVKRMRRYEEAHASGRVDPDLGLIDGDKMNDIRQAFTRDLHADYLERRARLKALIMNQGEFINMPDDTRNSVVSTLTNKTSWFRDPNIAKAFSRDELDISVLTKRPCLFLVGAPMAKLKVGSLFVASLLSNLTINSVFARGMDIERNAKGVSKHGVFFLLDEFPQLAIKSAPQVLATFRGFLAGVVMVFQERGQLRQLYSEDANTMESNTVHKVLLQGAHEETAEFYATKAIGEVQITKRSQSGAPGEKKSVSESIENVPLMTTTDVKSMRLNGRPRPNLALSVGADVPAFPLRPIPFYEDPVQRRLLGLRKRVVRKGSDGQPTWRFWEWSERWEPPEGGAPYLRRASSSQEEPDLLEQYVTYLAGRRKGAEYPALTVPRLVLSEVGVIEAAPDVDFDDEADHMADAPEPVAEPRRQPPRKGGADSPVPTSMVVPIYGDDIRSLLNVDFNVQESFERNLPTCGPVQDRVDTFLGTGAEEE